MTDAGNKAVAPVSGQPDQAQEIKTVFHKSTAFRVVYADGIWYEGDQNGNIRLIFYNERGVLPIAIVSKPVQQGNMVALITDKRVVDGQVDREIECEIVMSFASASQLADGLAKNLANMQKTIEGTIPETVMRAMKEAASSVAKETAAKK